MAANSRSRASVYHGPPPRLAVAVGENLPGESLQHRDARVSCRDRFVRAGWTVGVAVVEPARSLAGFASIGLHDLGRPRAFIERKTLHSGNFGVGGAHRSLAKKWFIRAEMERDFMGDRAIHSLGFFSCRLVFMGVTDSGIFSRGTISLGHGADCGVAGRNSFGSDADRTSRELHCANNRI